MLNADDAHIRLRWISTDATWHSGIEEYALADITKVDFGGRYVGALELVCKDRGD